MLLQLMAVLRRSTTKHLQYVTTFQWQCKYNNNLGFHKLFITHKTGCRNSWLLSISLQAYAYALRIYITHSSDYSCRKSTSGGFIITAELGRAIAVVKVTLQVNGNTQYSGVRHPKTTGAIKIKSGTNDYVGEGNPHAKFDNNQITGGFSPYRWNIPFGLLPITFLFFF